MQYVFEVTRPLHTMYGKIEDFADEISDDNKHVEYLQTVRHSIQQNGGIFSGDIFNLVDVLSQILCDKFPSNRNLAMDLLCELIPSYQGDDLDSNMGLLFPQLLQNLLHHQLAVKKSVLQVLHIYYRHATDIGFALDLLIEHGIKTEMKAVRNEVCIYWCYFGYFLIRACNKFVFN